VEVRNSSNIAYDAEFGGLSGANMTLREYLDGFPTRGGGGGEGSDPDPAYLFSTQPLQGLRADYTEPAIFFPGAGAAGGAEGKDGAAGGSKRLKPGGGAEQEHGPFAMNASARDSSALFYFGPAAAGVSIHQHTNAWNALVYGRKRWFLLPPYTLWGPTGMPMVGGWVGGGGACVRACVRAGGRACVRACVRSALASGRWAAFVIAGAFRLVTTQPSDKTVARGTRTRACGHT
jgi:hypothetical protein